MRRDQIPPEVFQQVRLAGAAEGRGAGGTSINRRMRVAFRRSISTQNLRSSKASAAKPKLRAELSDIGKTRLASSASVQRPQDTASVGGRAEARRASLRPSPLAPQLLPEIQPLADLALEAALGRVVEFLPAERLRKVVLTRECIGHV